MSSSSILHPITEGLEYLIKQGYDHKVQVALVAFKFACYLVDHVAVVFLHFKFFIFAVERWYAINKKGKASDNSVVALSILGGLITFISLEVLLKAWLFWKFDTVDQVGVRLKKGFAVTASASFLGASYIVFSFSLAVGILVKI
ncbi:unnamed protein product [Bursaphelenchus okinawaensis]|uniref:Uncharacterized protein n=1 Tax=Bursaphelenchus okinawaensis TaxID=465554 RepID=A0A811KR48_9BILA|nr:unnamed protein product [Bursaphelenchus okinawaensis]CAG9111193.1 unnamed protein product [Bursaphelenchus okinawaensis]